MITTRTACVAYCDAGPHSGSMREASMPLGDFKAWLRGQGWLVTTDGRTYCRDHRAKAFRA